MTRTFTLIVVAAGLLALPLLGCKGNPAGAATPTSKDIVDTAMAEGNFHTLLTALKAAGMTDTLKGKGPYTLFAPTDAAFAKLPAGTLDSLMKPESKDKLARMLKYHVVSGKLMADKIAKMKTLGSMAGVPLMVKAEAGKVMVDGATVTKPDIMASNGIIHVIDMVLMPMEADQPKKMADPEPKDIVDTAAAAENFKTFMKAVKAADLTDTLKGAGPYTVFAPTDAAWDKLPAGTLDDLMKPENKAKLAGILKYHVVQGKMTSDAIGKAKTLPTLGGTPLIVTDQEGKVMVDNAKIIQPDVVCSNGVIHGVDTVMMPAEAKPAEKQSSDAEADDDPEADPEE